MQDSGHSQKRVCPQLYFHSSEIYIDSCNNAIKRIGINVFKNKISVRYINGSKRFISPDSLWGFRNKNINPTRLFKKDGFVIRRYSPVIVYAQSRIRGYAYFFSKTLDSPIFSFTEKRLKQEVDQLTYENVINDKKLKRLLY